MEKRKVDISGSKQKKNKVQLTVFEVETPTKKDCLMYLQVQLSC